MTDPPQGPPRAPPLEFRVAEAADIAAVGALVQSSYRGESSRRGWTTEADLLDGQRTDADELAAIIGRPDTYLLLAEIGPDLVGCCQVEWQGAGRSYLGMFAVQPGRQGRGVGRAIVAEAERRARHSWAATEMRMTVIRQRAELIAWYERLGYQRTGETVPFPYDNLRFGVPRTDDLEFVVLTKPLGHP